MQSTTWSVGSVEVVVLAGAEVMASGGIVSPSATAGGKSVVGRPKRKSLPGLSITSTYGKKKICSSANEDGAAVKNSGGVTVKRKEWSDEIKLDPSLADAALVLTEFSRKPARFPSPSKSLEPSHRVLQWGPRKLRSRRVKRLESPTNEDSRATATESSPTQQPPEQQASECSCSTCGDSQSVITLVKVEEGPFCSSRTRLEEEEQVEQPKEGEGAELQEMNDPERLPKLTSVSSVESLQADSRSESPSSPLPTVLRSNIYADLLGAARFDDSPLQRSAFQRVVPIRPVKKQTLGIKLKAEEKTFEDLNPEQAAVKHVSRKKPRPMGFGSQPPPTQPLSPPSPQQQQLAPVKVEEAEPDTMCALALGPPVAPVAEQAEVKKAEDTSITNPLVVDQKWVNLDPAVIKVERPSGRGFLQRVPSKAKAALSESEKEARKQRRVQANRESARLTIRKKQVLCEELSKKAQHLSAENEHFRRERELMLQKRQSLSEANVQLKEQLTKKNGKPGSSSPTPSSVDKKSPDSLPQFQIPMSPIAPYMMWYLNMAQAAQAARVGAQSSEIKIGSAEYSAALYAAAAAAAAACGSNTPAGFWQLAGSSQGQSAMLPLFFPGHQPGVSAANALPLSSAGAPRTISPSDCVPHTIAPVSRSVSLPVALKSLPFSLVDSERSLKLAKHVPSSQPVDFVDSSHPSHDLKRNTVKHESTHQGPGSSGRAHHFQMTPVSQTGLPPTGVGCMATQKLEGSCLPLLGRSHSLGAKLVPKVVHSRFPMLSPAGRQEQPTGRVLESQRKAASATEARRKRRELKLSRTKSSVQQRQMARVAEPSA